MIDRVFGFALPIVSAGRVLGAVRGLGLFVGAVTHVERAQNHFLHHLCERLVGEIAECELDNGDSAARILVGLKRRAREKHWSYIGRGLSIEDLNQRGPGQLGIIAGETETVVGSGGVADERSRGDGYRRVPGFQYCVDTVIELEAAFFDQFHGGHRRYGLTDGGGLKRGGGFDAAAGFDVGDAVGFGPVDFKIADDGDAHAGDVEAAHKLGEGVAVEALMVGLLRGFDAGDDGRRFVLGRSRENERAARETKSLGFSA